MPSLQTLPPELLLAIGDRLEERDIYALLLVNRRFSRVFLNYLYCHNRIRQGSSALIWGMNHENEGVVRRALAQNPTWRPESERARHFRFLFHLCVARGQHRIVRSILRHRVCRCLQSCLEETESLANDLGYYDLADEIMHCRFANNNA
ncbi:hypothetical protein N7509_005807 [Penicillium cosmopolitanum]|uniref:F-box domain-containing protein n=1 Tax=Penicillium cosmopolitanum TaxID=1131564 RepID=A0A9W9W2V7_9EURO|nr:uncharacterized protein N7509_005807 [Penicillium cosmopolitanum]KAJ5397694.1 hypothetical protein N7509_005807 [Penicillium cosmopolitanum]